MKRKTNEFVAWGAITGIYKNKDDSHSITIVIKSGDRSNFPRFYTKEDVSGYNIGDHIVLEGYTRGYATKDSDSSSLHQFLVATSLAPQKTICEEAFSGKKGNFYKHGDIRILYQGTVTSVTESGQGWYHVSLLTDEIKKDFVHFNLKTSDHLIIPKKNDKAAFVCKISTTKKEYNGQTKFYENIHVLDFGYPR
jgi:hypothetical protein